MRNYEKRLGIIADNKVCNIRPLSEEIDDLSAAKLAFLQQNGQLKGYLAAKLAFLQQNGQLKGYLAAKTHFLQQTYTLARLSCQSREQRPPPEGPEMKIDVHDPPETDHP